MKKRKILVIDDQANTLKVLKAILQDEDYDVITAQNGSDALEFFKSYVDIEAVLADLKMPGMDGMELYRKIRELDGAIPYVIMTAHGSIESAVSAMKEGVTNYLIKPLNYDELFLVLDRAIREREMSRELDDLRQETREKYSFQNIIGSAKKMKEIFELVNTAAPTDATIHIQGETGTGKELLARAIHSLSGRRRRNMVCINSAALTESLLEAELFGYVKGAFTGAVSDKKGRIEMADRGTLFLDEIGHMSKHLQAKLLRFLEERTFEPVGSVEAVKVDVRLISATNHNLQEEIESGRFLSDLFYRIDVITLEIPPLRERREDIPLLVDYFIKRYADQYKKEIEAIDSQAMERLIEYPWLGNVRQLENCIARAVILCEKPQIQLADFPEKIRFKDNGSAHEFHADYIRHIPSSGLKLKDMEKELIQKTLVKCQGNKSLAADLLGISRKALYEKIQRLGILT